MAEITQPRKKEEREDIEEAEQELKPKRVDGRTLGRKSVEDDKVRGISSIADNSITAAMLQSNAVTNPKIADDAVKQSELDYETANVTVSAGSSSGTATVTSGSIVIGWRPTGNQDQFIDNISVSGTTLTITLGANATADNTFQVTLLKQ